VLEDIERFGLGQERSLEEYQHYSGINFAQQRIKPYAKQGTPFPPFSRNGTHIEQDLPVTTMSPKVHKPRKVFESPGGVVYDDFLPEDIYQQVYHFACVSDYERINTHGRVKKVWRIRDGFPLRSLLNLYYFADNARCPKPKPDWAYPTNTPLDLFAEHLNQLAPQAAPYIGKAKRDWDRFSATAWIYPRDTALSLHDDGSGIYSGAFTYFLNPHWDIHWGGLLLFIDPHASQALQDYDDAGDNCRMSLAGFFQKPKKK
jgi:hypothetical protein